MGRGRSEQALENVLDLAQIHPVDDAEEARLDRVMESLREEAGEIVTKAVAARVLKVSRNTLDKWIKRGLIVSRGRGVDRQALEEIALKVSRLRESGKNRPLFVEALNRLEQEDPAWQRRMQDIQGVRTTDDDLVSAAPGADWDPED